MQGRVTQEIRELLAEAENSGACLATRSRRIREALERRVADGTLVSPLPLLYVDRELWLGLTETQRTLHLMRGIHTLHPSWVFCGTSAAVAHGLSVTERLQRPLEVATLSGARRCHAHGSVRQVHVSDDEPVTASGIPVTSAERTVFDCARHLGFREGLAIADSSLRVGATDHARLVSYVSSMGTRYRGSEIARRAASLADPRPENGMESIARATMYELGFAAPELQVPFCDPMDPRKVHRVDFLWVLPDGTLVIGELDGGEKYASPVMNGGTPLVAMRGERRRESRLTLERPRIIRFSPEEVLDVGYFDRLLETFGVPRDHTPLIKVPEEQPFSETVPVEAYGLR